jgi:hypothetical protein
MKLVFEVQKLTQGYSRTGGKDNRKQQRARMLGFAEHAARSGATSLEQVGRLHVITYWKSHRDLSDKTLYSHWLAIRDLWKLSGKLHQPPRPWSSSRYPLKLEETEPPTT